MSTRKARFKSIRIFTETNVFYTNNIVTLIEHEYIVVHSGIKLIFILVLRKKLKACIVNDSFSTP